MFGIHGYDEVDNVTLVNTMAILLDFLTFFEGPLAFLPCSLWPFWTRTKNPF